MVEENLSSGHRNQLVKAMKNRGLLIQKARYTVDFSYIFLNQLLKLYLIFKLTYFCVIFIIFQAN